MENTLQIEVEELASLQFSEEEILTIVGEDKQLEEIWIRRGKLKAEAEVRKSILSQAKQGSSPAQKAYMDMIKKHERCVNLKLLKEDISKIVYGSSPKEEQVRNRLINKLGSLVVKYE